MICLDLSHEKTHVITTASQNVMSILAKNTELDKYLITANDLCSSNFLHSKNESVLFYVAMAQLHNCLLWLGSCQGKLYYHSVVQITKAIFFILIFLKLSKACYKAEF